MHSYEQGFEAAIWVGGDPELESAVQAHPFCKAMLLRTPWGTGKYGGHGTCQTSPPLGAAAGGQQDNKGISPVLGQLNHACGSRVKNHVYT